MAPGERATRSSSDDSAEVIAGGIEILRLQRIVLELFPPVT
jgi:hypothetical protein